MKLLIDSDLSYSTTYYPSATDETLDEYQDFFSDIEACLNSFNVSCAVTNARSGASVTIYTQKIVLTDENMNTLFADVLTELFDVKIEYAHLGGRGCEFSMRILPTTVPACWVDAP